MITVKKGSLEYLTALDLNIPHAFTTRLGGVSEGIYSSLNIAKHRGDSDENVEKNYEILANALDFDLNNLVMTRQIHSDLVRAVSKNDACGLDHRNYPECDALITNDAGTALVIFTADCTPILLWDSVKGAVGAVHAGWRGTVYDIAGKTVLAMASEFGCKPQNIRAAIGPNIGVCCFETDRDVPDLLRAQFGDDIEEFIIESTEKIGKYHVDLKKINALALRRAGVESIEISDDCTMCRPDRFWSHRVTGTDRGSQGAVIVCKGEKMSKIEEMILDRDFKYLRPYFYKNKWALRCELGIGTDGEYEVNAKKRATEIYNILFPQGADAIIFNYWFMDYSGDGRAELDGYGEYDVAERMNSILDYECDRLRFLLEYQARYRHRTLRTLPTDEIYTSVEIDGGFPLMHRVIFYSDGRGFDADCIIDRQIGESFGHEISFVSFENECILSIYDSRGCDIVFATQEKMKEFYHTIAPYFLDYDRAEMERRYNEGE